LEKEENKEEFMKTRKIVDDLSTKLNGKLNTIVILHFKKISYHKEILLATEK
jgi:hypothetical protein